MGFHFEFNYLGAQVSSLLMVIKTWGNCQDKNLPNTKKWD